MKAKSCPFVYVLWHDAEHPSTGEWIMRADLDKSPSLTVETGGFLVNRTRKLLQVAVSVASRGAEDEQYTGVMNIPFGCVEKIIEFPASGGSKVTYQKRAK
jgi:hypothetical protein